jgi:hypothetical protein
MEAIFSPFCECTQLIQYSLLEGIPQATSDAYHIGNAEKETINTQIALVADCQGVACGSGNAVKTLANRNDATLPKSQGRKVPSRPCEGPAIALPFSFRRLVMDTRGNRDEQALADEDHDAGDLCTW